MRRAILRTDLADDDIGHGIARLPRTNDLARIHGRFDVGRITAIADGVFWIEFRDGVVECHPWEMTGFFTPVASQGFREITRLTIGVLDGRGCYQE